MSRIDHVTNHYGARAALENVSFHVTPGGRTGFGEANGSGKTTAMRIIMGLLNTDSGQVTLDDRPLSSASVCPAVIAHGAVNGATGTLLIVVAAGADESAVFGTLLGWPGWILLAAVIAVLVVTGQLTKRATPGLSAAEVSSATATTPETARTPEPNHPELAESPLKRSLGQQAEIRMRADAAASGESATSDRRAI